MVGILEYIELSLDNIDANDVVITSDYGNAIGKLGVYGNPVNISIGPLRRVPLVETSTNNIERYVSDLTTDPSTSGPVEDQLKSLGYTA
jgi:hypothetical protein